jgi:hypothetical protein
MARDDDAHPEHAPLDVRIIGAEDDVSAIGVALEAKAITFTTGSVSDPSYFGLDFVIVADVVAVLAPLALSDLVLSRVDAWRSRNERRRRILVETPIGRVAFESDEDLTDEEVRSRLQSISRMMK